MDLSVGVLISKFFCLKAQVSDIAWLALASASFPKRNKNGIKIWPQWDSCLTWQAAPQATIVEIKQILEQSCIRERDRFISGNN